MRSDRWTELLDQSRAVAHAEASSRQRWLRRQAEETATFVGVLHDLGERRSRVAIVVDGRRVSGRLVGVGIDFIVLEDRADHVAVALRGVSLVRPDADRGAATGDRSAAIDLHLVELLAQLVGEDVAIALLGGETVSGSLLGVGADVVTVRAGDAGPVYCSTAALSSARFPG